MRLPGLRTLLPALFALTTPLFAQSPIQSAIQPASIQPDRIAARPDFAARAPLAGHVPLWATPSRDQGPVPAATPVSLTLSLSRSPQLQAAFDQLLLDQQNPSSPRYHQWLTPQQVGEQFGPTQNDLDTLTSWLTAQGLHVESIAPSRIFIHATAPASTVNAVFQTSLHTFNHLARPLMEPVSEPIIPAALTPIVQYIQGLSQVDYRTHSHQLPPIPISQTNIKPATGTSATIHPDLNVGDGSVHYLSPADFATIYDVPSSITGTAQKVAIIGGSRLLASDLTTWESLSGLPSYQPNYIIPPPSACGTITTTTKTQTANACADPGTTNNEDQGEGTLDFERVYGTAPGASVDQIISTNWLDGSVTYELISYAINTVNDPILSMSFGACEAEQSTQFLAYENSLFATAASQGISIFASSGDSGADSCEAQATPPSTTVPQTLAISDICSSIYVTCVGGTQFSDTANPSAYWSSSNSSNSRSALSYIPEGAWNEPTTTDSKGGIIYAPDATGGGVSAFTAKPSFQSGAGVPADGARDVPDISFSASTHNGYFSCLSYAGADCSKYLTGFGGTSASAPSMAGVAALLDQKLSGRQGSLNPLLYKLAASTPGAFHDAIPATSGVTSCTTSTPSTCNNSNPSATGLSGGLAGYPLTTGYDLATGLGSLDVNAFLNAAATPTLATTSTTLTASPTTTITVTQTVVFNAAIASTTTGTPTGSVTFTSNGTPLGSPVTLAAGKAATPSLSFTTAGTYSIIAAYSGDSTFAASTSTLSFRVTVSALATTTSISLPTSPTVTAIQASTFTATVAPSAANSTAPTGTVQFLVDGAPRGNPAALSGTTATSTGITFTAGTHTVSAMYLGDSIFAASTSGFDAVTSTLAPTTIAFTTAPATANQYASTTFVTTVSGLSAATATNATVTFKDATTGAILSNAPIVYSGVTATATLATAFTASGNHIISVQFTGDTSTYAASNTVTASINVTAAPTFTLTPASPTLTLASASSQSGMDVITAATTNGYTGSISFSCAVTLTSGGTALIPPTCIPNPTSITFPAATTTTVTLGTVAPHAVQGGTQSALRTIATGATLTVAGLLFFLLPVSRRRTPFPALAGALLLVATLVTLSGCGTTTGGTSKPINPTGGTTTGAYTVTITGTTTTGIPATTTTIALTVQ